MSGTTARARVLSLQTTCRARAQDLAQRLKLPFEQSDTGRWSNLVWQGLLLLVAEDGLALADSRRPRMRPLRIDFQAENLRRRAQRASARGEALARAIGLSRHPDCLVVDATAGLGRDSFLLASLGCEVLMLECDPLLVVLLEDGMARARRNGDKSLVEVLRRMRLEACDARVYLGSLTPMKDRYTVVYLDPMFGAARRRAAAGREMQLLQELHGPESACAGLLDAALSSPCARVVVKRPLKAVPLDQRRPSHVITGRSTRFDVYQLG